jgi:class 3 adenylate cyclase
MAGSLRASEREIERQAKLHGDLSRYLSKELVDSIVSGKQSLQLGGRRMQITVLFADVVAFTPLTESRGPEEVVVILNELFSLITEIVFRHEGIVDKFIGDCVMAVWGSPISTEDHAQKALTAAEDIMRFLESANDNWSKRYGVEIRLGVGINTGFAIVGNIGSDKRMEFTAIGDVVNVAARLEAIAAPNQVLVGSETAKLCGEAFPLASLGNRRLTGRSTETEVFELSTT